MSESARVLMLVAAVTSTVITASGCSKSGPSSDGVSDANLVKRGATTARTIGDSNVQLQVAPQSLVSGDATSGDPAALTLGLPVSLLGQPNVFGAVITKVSDHNDQSLGMLKLTDLPPLNVTPKLAKTEKGDVVLALFGCVEKCTKDSAPEVLVTFPVVSIDEKAGHVNIDLSAAGSDFDLMALLDPKGEATHLVSKSAVTTAVDFSNSTLVFDVDSHMVPAKADPAKPQPAETIISARWYLKLHPVTDANFVSRDPVAAAGFFKTERGAATKITRYSAEAGPVHYYLKGIPTEFRAAFAASLDGWNAELKQIVGHELLTYEFVEEKDPRFALLVPGDIRYNIISWDVDNRAPYGGLGPSIADQLTGQTMASNILIQGPHIVEIYKQWFASSDAARTFKKLGMGDVADQLMLKTSSEINARMAVPSKLALKLGGKLAFRVVAQLDQYMDPPAERTDFELLPEGETFDSYMPGYFQDMVTHELGHNLGLRHNFRGTLGAADGAPSLEKVSRSIMDYMGRDFRFLDRIGDYDRMAISYGYAGTTPTHSDWFCTDEDQGAAAKPANSAECSQNDATNDPFSYFESMLSRSIGVLTNRDRATAPTWSVDDLATPLKNNVAGLLNYAESAEKTASSWTNFFGKPGRPADGAGVKAYVVRALKAQLCDPSLAQLVAGKESQAARDATSKNIDALRARVADIVKPYQSVTAAELACP